MLLVNKLTEPGAIKKISLYPEMVRVEIRNGKDIVYRKVSISVPESWPEIPDGEGVVQK